MNITVMKDPKGYLSDEEIEKVLSSCSNIRDYVIIRILSRTGIRVSELLGIRAKDLDFEHNQITIRQLKTRKEAYRVTYIDKETSEILKQYRLTKRINADDYLIPVTRQTVFKIVRSVGKKAGIEMVGNKRIHPHHFRHSYVMRGIKKGIDIRKLQLMVGHSSFNTTAGYLNYGSKELKDEYSKMF